MKSAVFLVVMPYSLVDCCCCLLVDCLVLLLEVGGSTVLENTAELF
jgi:hypothetical protein